MSRQKCDENAARLLARATELAPEIAEALARWDLADAASLSAIALRYAKLAGDWKRQARGYPTVPRPKPDRSLS